MLSAADLQAIRDAVATALPDTLDIQRPARVPDGALGQTETLVTVAGGVRCRVYELGEGRGDRELELAGMTRSDGTHLVRVPVGTDVRHQDVLLWSGRRLSVTRVLHRSYATVLTVLCTEVVP